MPMVMRRRSLRHESSTDTDDTPVSSPVPPHSQSQSASAAAVAAIQTQDQQQQAAVSVDSDMVVILASLLCALICVAGLALVARCACHRRRRGATTGGGGGFAASLSSQPTAPAAAPKGLKKKAIEALPTVSYQAPQQVEVAVVVVAGECAICLGEFREGDELRVLPHCAHGFHVACIDTWLAAHATCPSCRAAISPTPPPTRCRRCGAACDQLDAAHAAPPPPAVSPSSPAAAAAAAAVAGDGS
ncbi:hypothetical protein ACP4OV_000006 [Aristida adscensionis]